MSWGILGVIYIMGTVPVQSSPKLLGEFTITFLKFNLWRNCLLIQLNSMRGYSPENYRLIELIHPEVQNKCFWELK